MTGSVSEQLVCSTEAVASFISCWSTERLQRVVADPTSPTQRVNAARLVLEARGA